MSSVRASTSGRRRLRVSRLHVSAIVVVGLLLTALACLSIKRTDGVYFSQVDVVLIAPPTDARPNSFGDTTQSLIALAGVLEREYNAGAEATATSSSGVTLVDRGIYEGTFVELPNAGGQWAYFFQRPVLSVQAASRTSSQVPARMDAVITRIRDILAEKEAAAGVEPQHRIRVDLSPQTPEVQYLYGRHSRALLVAGFLGCMFTAVGAVTCDRRRRKDLPDGRSAT